jgi:ankyrin
LVKAVKERDILRLESLAPIPELVNAPDPEKHTPLHVACQLGFVEEAMCLLENGAQVEARNLMSQTPLSIAVLAGNIALVHLLIERGANMSAIDGWGETPLHHACQVGSLAMVAALLAATPSDCLIHYVNHLSRQSDSPLLYASLGGGPATFLLLLENGAEPNMEVRIGSKLYPGSYWLPSSAAGLEILNLLAVFGAKLFCGNSEGWNHLHINSLRGRVDLCRELSDINVNGPKIDRAKIARDAAHGTSKLNVNAKTNEGYTALFLAVSNGHTNTVRFLLEELGADSRIKCPLLDSESHLAKESYTPLAIASFLGHAEIVSSLIRTGARLDKTSACVTPHFIAAQHGRLEVCRILIDAGASVNFMRPLAGSVLSIAARYGHVKVMEILLKEGARAWPASKRVLRNYGRVRFDSFVPDKSSQKIKLLLCKYLGGSF